MCFRELLSPFHVSGTNWVTGRKNPAKLNTHKEGTWTVSRGLNPNQLTPLSGFCARRKNPSTGNPPHLVSLCPTSTSSYTLSSWETAAVNANAGQKMVRRCHSEPVTLLRRKIWAAAHHSTQRGQGNAEGASGLPSSQQRSSTRNDAWVGWLCLWAVFCMGLAIQLQGWSSSSSTAPALHCSQPRQGSQHKDLGMVTPDPPQG